MNSISHGLVNGLCNIISILVNAFFIFCMVCPLQGQQIKQPLKLLLWTLICCTMIFMMLYLANYLSMLTGYTELMAYAVYVYTLVISKSSSVWLNFFYFTQIVPAQRACFIWIKKNIKPVIYCIWINDKIFSLFDVCSMLLPLSSFQPSIMGSISYNFTIHNGTIYSQRYSLLRNVSEISLYFVAANFILCQCIMVMSCSSTASYLCKHMRRMVANGQPLSSSQFRSQIRVTITGILQGILYLFCATWTTYMYFIEDTSTSDSSYAHITVINLYMLGTTLNLGAGQTVFRQRSADIWFRAVQWCKRPDVQQTG